jgi:DNA-binding MarR family transcriptional regulator
MDTSRSTPDACARTVMEMVPMVMRFIRAGMRRNRASSLSVPQLRALAFLDHNPGSCLFHVADHLGVTTPTASVIVDRLVRRGLLRRSEDPQERRRLVLMLTGRGSRHLEQARRATRAWIADVLAPLPRPALHRMEEGIRLLGSAFKRESLSNGRKS